MKDPWDWYILPAHLPKKSAKLVGTYTNPMDPC